MLIAVLPWWNSKLPSAKSARRRVSVMDISDGWQVSSVYRAAGGTLRGGARFARLGRRPYRPRGLVARLPPDMVKPLHGSGVRQDGKDDESRDGRIGVEEKPQA